MLKKVTVGRGGLLIAACSPRPTSARPRPLDKIDKHFESAIAEDEVKNIKQEALDKDIDKAVRPSPRTAQAGSRFALDEKKSTRSQPSER